MSTTTTNNTNASIPNGDDLSGNNLYLTGPVYVIAQTVILSITSVLAIGYSALLLIRPAFRNNKLNWFTINVCLATIWLCIIFLLMDSQQLSLVPLPVSCRALGFLVDMGACQLIYSHAVIAVSRLVTVVYGNKRVFQSNMCLWICISTGWFISILIALPYLFIDGFACPSLAEVGFMSYYTLITTLIIPISVFTACNIRTLLFVRSSTRRIHATGVGGHVSHAHDVLLLRVTIGTFVAFLVGWIPTFVVQLFNLSASLPATVNICLQLLPALVLLYDIMLLIGTNQPVRTLLKQSICGHLKINARRNEPQRNVPIR